MYLSNQTKKMNLEDFEPYSSRILEYLQEIKNNVDRQLFLEEILNDKRSTILFQNLDNGTKTVLYNLHKKGNRWEETLQMAKALNDKGKSVAFLPEYDTISSADAITSFKGKLRIADFKYSTKNNYNTIAEELIKGFSQANLIVLKMEQGDLGTLKKVVSQINRKNFKMVDLILINKYNKVAEITEKEFLNNKFTKILKGFL